MKPEKKPPKIDGLFWRILAVVGTAASIAGLVFAIINMAR